MKFPACWTLWWVHATVPCNLWGRLWGPSPPPALELHPCSGLRQLKAFGLENAKLNELRASLTHQEVSSRVQGEQVVVLKHTHRGTARTRARHKSHKRASTWPGTGTRQGHKQGGTRIVTGVRCGGGLPAAFAPGAAPAPSHRQTISTNCEAKGGQRNVNAKCERTWKVRGYFVRGPGSVKRQQQRRLRMRRNKPAARRVARQKDRQPGPGTGTGSGLACLPCRVSA